MTRPTVDSHIREVTGAKGADALESKLDLHTVGDLLHHYPRRYTERGELTSIGDALEGEYVTVAGKILRVSSRPMQRRKGWLTEAWIGQGDQSIKLTFFNQTWRAKFLVVGAWGLFSGKVSRYGKELQLNQADYELIGELGVRAPAAAPVPGGTPLDELDQELALEDFTNALIPIYPAAAHLPSWRIGAAVRNALRVTVPAPDPLPLEVRNRRHLPPLWEALESIHRPTSDKALWTARYRLKWDEAFGLQAAFAQRRLAANARPATPRPARADGLLAGFDAVLPFVLTDGQASIGEVLRDGLAEPHPMHRLLQGEVGSGKTLVALRAMLQVVDAGGQAALLAPTEVLAGQHARSIAAMLGPLARGGELDAAEQATRVALLTGSLSAPARRRAREEIATGAAGIVIGTHALLSEGVDFADLGFVVVDEQHRFGVEQRDALRAKGGETPPHVLVMTATPIPRTVAMTVFGDLETSALTELPRGRSPISSTVVPAAERPGWLTRAWQRIVEEVGKGHQAYVVCPRIGDGPSGAGTDDGLFEPPPDEEEPAAKRPPLAVLEVAPMLAEGPLADVRVGVLHGRLPTEEKDAVMADFAAGRLDVLVATTVVEVGVDVPNATGMVIMDADRFGVSQLHQLRGRVGRGSAPGLCLLVTDAPPDSKARVRLDAVAATTDGFALAQLDLEQRREGDVLGAAQSGRRSQLRLLSLLHDADIITAARDEATALVAHDPELLDHPALAAIVANLLDDAEYLEKT